MRWFVLALLAFVSHATGQIDKDTLFIVVVLILGFDALSGYLKDFPATAEQRR